MATPLLSFSPFSLIPCFLYKCRDTQIPPRLMGDQAQVCSSTIDSKIFQENCPLNSHLGNEMAMTFKSHPQNRKKKEVPFLSRRQLPRRKKQSTIGNTKHKNWGHIQAAHAALCFGGMGTCAGVPSPMLGVVPLTWPDLQSGHREERFTPYFWLLWESF